MNKRTNIYPNLSGQTKFRINEINKIKYYYHAESQEGKIMGKKLNKYIATFDYFDKTLIVLYPRSGGISIITFASTIGAPVGIESASFSLTCSLTIGIKK